MTTIVDMEQRRAAAEFFVELAHRAYAKAFPKKGLWFHVYGNQEKGYHVEAVDDNGGFTICDDIPNLGWAKTIAAALNAVARTMRVG
jgi:hypothetical protein